MHSLRLTQQQEAGLRERLGKVQVELLALNERKRGKQRLRTVEELSQAAQQIIERYRVVALMKAEPAKR